MSAPAEIRPIRRRIPPVNGSSTPRQRWQPKPSRQPAAVSILTLPVRSSNPVTTTTIKHKKCTVCGYTMATETIPANYHIRHKWIRRRNAPSCGYTMATETIPATGGGEHTHSYGSEWKNDADNHWHECSCGDKDDVAAHSFKWVVDKEATATKKGSKHEECKVCGYKKAAVEIPATGSTTKPTDPTQTNPNTGAESPKTGDNSNRILWIALLFIIGGAVIGITVYRKKKKENAE